MTRYFIDGDGVYLGGFDGVQPPAGAVEVARAPADARQTWTGAAWGDVPERPYRERRKDAYARELGEDRGDVVNTMGDVLDAVIKHIYGDTAELDAMVTKIAAIKAAHPKPGA
jgi:hypothetical protein